MGPERGQGVHVDQLDLGAPRQGEPHGGHVVPDDLQQPVEPGDRVGGVDAAARRAEIFLEDAVGHQILQPGRVEVGHAVRGELLGAEDVGVVAAHQIDDGPRVTAAEEEIHREHREGLTGRALGVAEGAGKHTSPSVALVAIATAATAFFLDSRASSNGSSEPAAASGVAVMICVWNDPRSRPAIRATAQATNGVTATQASAPGTRPRSSLRDGVTITPPTDASVVAFT